MGVPKFFRWISERYPNISVSIENNQIPAFDCLYLDMNGIIHVCSHPDDENVLFRITEEQIFSNVFKYVDFLFKTVKPKEVFFLAVDGVAPRAKMNQQRGRRFKSSKETKDRDFAAIKTGVILPKQKKFDSNAITPGTEFMDRLHHALSSFLADKIRSDYLWQGIDVILSGHETPGEGEHKIQEYIRYKRSLPNYNPNTRHCLYGLDADLILLGLACHEPYFALLREEVTFTAKNKSRRAYIAEETKFFLLHLSLLRGYIDLEFDSLKPILGNDYDLERIIDDWIVLSFFVGNDFVPHLPNLHIQTSALPLLWQKYIKIRPLMNGYINTNGALNIKHLLTFVSEFSEFDHKHFEIESEDMKEEIKDNEMTETSLIDFDEVAADTVVTNLSNELDLQSIKISDEENGDGVRKKQFNAYKTGYYFSKLGLQSSPEVLENQAKEYFTALQWISFYYFSGVPSWSWFYSQHYAPFVSDLLYLSDNVKENGIVFDLGKPFLPFEQLMAVLPSDSSELLPDCFSILMTMKNSPIRDFYPNTFQTDLNGKKREWEAIVLIPFIDVARLLSALETHKILLTDKEARRNVHGPHIKFRFSQKQLTTTEIDPSVFRISRDSMKFGLCRDVQLDVICQGFPSFSHVDHYVTREKAYVRVFENFSVFESLVLRIKPLSISPSMEMVAYKVLDELVYVNWPTFFLTKIVAVLNTENRITLDPVSKNLITTPLDEVEIKKVKDYIARQPQESYKRRAILLDLSHMIILESLQSDGNVYVVSCHKSGCITRLDQTWVNHKTRWHLHQLSVLYKSINSLQSDDSRACTKLSQLFPINALVFCLDRKYYGQNGKVQSINNNRGSIVLRLEALKEPEYSDTNIEDFGVDYMTLEQVSQCLDMDSFVVSKITDSVFIGITRASESNGRQKMYRKDRHSIGLDLKNNKFNLQVPGWTKKTKGDNRTATWLYSMKVVNALKDYRHLFPQVFEFVKRPNFENLTSEDLFNVEGDINLLERRYEELRSFLINLEYRGEEKLSNDHVLLSEAQIAILENVSEDLDNHTHTIRTEEPVEVELEFQELYRPHISLQGTKPDASTEYRLLDRVVCSTDNYTVPIGLRGVVVGIETLAKDRTRMEVLFDSDFESSISIRGSNGRCYRMPDHTLINTSHGLREFDCYCKLIKKTPASQSIVSDSSQSIFNAPYKLGQSDLLSALFSASATELPPMPLFESKKANNVTTYENRNNGPVNDHRENNNHPISQKKTNNVVVDKPSITGAPLSPAIATATFTTVINMANCPEPYAAVFHICSQCAIIDATVLERHLNNDIFMSFKCNLFAIAETKETDLVQGRLNHANRIWQQLYPLQLKPHSAPPNCQANPFTELYPSENIHLVHRNHDPTRETCPAHPLKVEAIARTMACVSSPIKPFIRAPKSKMFP